MQKSHKTKLILFDLDGTLIDTAPDFHNTLNNMLRKYQIDQVTIDEVRPHISEGTSKLIQKFFNADKKDPRFNLLKSEFLTEYSLNMTNDSKLFNGMASLINFLNENKITFGVVTNKFYRLANPINDSFSELNNIKVLICPDHVRVSKPDPEGILMACKKLNINPTNTIYLGDHINDLTAGIKAGTKILGCLYGYSLDENTLKKFNYPFVKKVSEVFSHINL